MVILRKALDSFIKNKFWVKYFEKNSKKIESLFYFYIINYEINIKLGFNIMSNMSEWINHKKKNNSIISE